MGCADTSCTLGRMSASTPYVMGHDKRERRRLLLQTSILNPLTEQLLHRSGISSGMNVLDIGCGVGDVSLLAARLVGRYGSVTSVDIDPAALQTLEARASAEGITNTSNASRPTFMSGSRAAGSTRSSAVTFSFIQEIPLPLCETVPPCCMSEAWRLFMNTIFLSSIAAGLPRRCENESWRSSIGSSPRHMLQRRFAPLDALYGSGIRAPRLSRGVSNQRRFRRAPTTSGSPSPFAPFSLVRIALGIVAEGEFDLGTLEQRLREEGTAGNSCFPAPAMIAAFTRLRV